MMIKFAYGLYYSHLLFISAVLIYDAIRHKPLILYSPKKESSLARIATPGSISDVMKGSSYLHYN